MSAETARHARSGGPLVVPPQPPPDRSIIDAVSGFINDVKLTSSSATDPKDVIQWARFEVADINEPTSESDNGDISPLLLILGYGSGVQAWLIPPSGEAQEVLSWRQGTVRVLRILPSPLTTDAFAAKRPLLALCDSASPGPTFCSLSFISIRGGEQVKSIKFKNPILDVLANKRSVVVSFSERFAVFDAGTLEDRMAVTTCYPCPCPLGGSAPINPLALGERWLAYADKKLNSSKRSSGGCEGDGVTSYTATVLHAAKSLGKGLRGLGESVAQSLAGAGARGASPPRTDHQPGVVTIIDIEGNNEDDCQDADEPYDPIIAHFLAHSEAILGMKFDPSGMLLITGDKRGHDFHVFRINPHPCGPALASVHHLYILHRGDTTAKLQDIAISSDSRWTAISTLRGTTHVFPITPYGGPCGVRTHTQPRVVNRLSRFHRSAGLPIHAAAPRSGSPIDISSARFAEHQVADGVACGAWFPNPRGTPAPQPTTVPALAQLRRQYLPANTVTRSSSGRQRLSSLSEDSNSPPLLARAMFGASPIPPVGVNKAPAQLSLYLISANGTLLHLGLAPRPAKGIPKEKICDDSSIELDVEGVAQWPLQRQPAAADLLVPLPSHSPLLHHPTQRSADMCLSSEEQWLSQVEIVTHAGPHRRLWMGPQFLFKTYTNCGSNSSLSEAETVEVGSAAARSTPVNMPGVRPIVPALIHSGSNSSLEHSPSDSFRRKSLLAETGRVASVCDVQLKEDLAEAMKEDQGIGGVLSECGVRARWMGGVARAVDPLGTVCAGGAAGSPPPAPDADLHTLANADEARFRPVVSCPGALPPPPPPATRSLPQDTTIPVQSAGLAAAPAPHDLHLAAPLAEHVTIPAAECHLATPITEQPHRDEAPTQTTQEQSLPISEPIDIQPAPRVKKSPTPESTADKDGDSFKSKKERKSKRDKPIEPSVNDDKNDSVKERENEVCVVVDDSVKIDSEKEGKDTKGSNRSSKRAKDNDNKSRVQDKEVTYETESNKNQAYTRAKKESSVEGDKDKVKPVTSESKANKKKGETQRKLLSSECKMIQNIEVKSREDSQTKTLPTRNELINSLNKNENKSRENSSEKNVTKENPREGSQPKSLKNEGENDKSSENSKKRTTHGESKNDKKSSKSLSEATNDQGDGGEITNIKSEITESKAPREFAIIDVKPELEDEPSVAVTLKLKPTKILEAPKVKVCDDTIKTEEQAWDMLLNETEKTVASMLQETKEVITEEPKPKSKRNRKNKRNNEESTVKAEDDSFVEIHNIEKTQECANDLVSISEPLTAEDYAWSAKSRSPKSATPEKPFNVKFEREQSFDVINETKIDIDGSNVEIQPEPSFDVFENIHVHHVEGTTSESTSFMAKEHSPKNKKCKSLSPYLDAHRKFADKQLSNSNKKDIIVIDTSKDEFPDIKITSGSKIRKKPLALEQIEVVDKQPIKSWSSIAAAKNKKPVDEVQPDIDTGVSGIKEISLQDQLATLCKRTDIMVAQCDAPTDLTFVEEHHAMPDLPPLEPLDFALDDFKLDVMRDSLLEVRETKNSPICKINIDDILSSIKETTSKVLESSTFNLVDLDKVPKTKEKGFSVVDAERISTQEIDINAGDKKADEEIMEKSSDDDNTSPVLSTDSDKDDKKAPTSMSTTLLKPGGQTKAKKSRRKKK